MEIGESIKSHHVYHDCCPNGSHCSIVHHCIVFLATLLAHALLAKTLFANTLLANALFATNINSNQTTISIPHCSGGIVVVCLSTGGPITQFLSFVNLSCCHYISYGIGVGPQCATWSTIGASVASWCGHLCHFKVFFGFAFVFERF